MERLRKNVESVTVSGKIYKIVGDFNPEKGLQLASSLHGVVAYAYKRSSWKSIQSSPNNKKFYFLELETQQSFYHVKKLAENGLKHLIIEETDILLPEYESGSFESFVKDIKDIVSLNINVYFNSTWKEEELSNALKKAGLTVNKMSLDQNLEEVKTEVIEKIETKEEKLKESTKTKYIKKEKSKEQNKKEQIVHKKQEIKQHIKEEHKQQLPTDLELFYSQRKTRWQRLKLKISHFFEKLTNNF